MPAPLGLYRFYIKVQGYKGFVVDGLVYADCDEGC